MRKFFKNPLTNIFFFFLYLLDIKEHCIKVAVKTLCLLYLLVISVCDMRTRRIPDCITGSVFALAFCLDVLLSCPKIPEKFFCGFLFFALLGAVSAITKGMGLGDAKVAAVLGYCIGFFEVLAILAFAAFLGIFGFCLFVLCKRKQDKLPFVPFMTLGYVITEVMSRRLM